MAWWPASFLGPALCRAAKCCQGCPLAVANRVEAADIPHSSCGTCCLAEGLACSAMRRRGIAATRHHHLRLPADLCSVFLEFFCCLCAARQGQAGAGACCRAQVEAQGVVGRPGHCRQRRAAHGWQRAAGGLKPSDCAVYCLSGAAGRHMEVASNPVSSRSSCSHGAQGESTPWAAAGCGASARGFSGAPPSQPFAPMSKLGSALCCIHTPKFAWLAGPHSFRRCRAVCGGGSGGCQGARRVPGFGEEQAGSIRCVARGRMGALYRGLRTSQLLHLA